jgi:hypothetical protein
MRIQMIKRALERLENSRNLGFHHFHMPDGSVRVVSNAECFAGFNDATNGNFDSFPARVVFTATASDFGPYMLKLLHCVIDSKTPKGVEA